MTSDTGRSTHMTLEERIERVEKQNRQLKCAVTALCVVGVSTSCRAANGDKARLDTRASVSSFGSSAFLVKMDSLTDLLHFCHELSDG